MSETITFETRILSGADDVEQGTSGAVIFDSSDLEMAVDRTVVQTIGLRFTRIDIPQGAIITSAYIQFQTEEVQTGTASLQIRGEDSDDAAAFTSASFNVSSRLQTDALVNWTPDPWGTIGETGLAQQTPNLAGIVQEIVNRSGWTPLNDIVFTVTGSGTRTAEAYEGGAAPILHIEYTLPTGNDASVGGISISDVMVTEGNSGTTTATFTVTRTGGTAAFSVNYATSNGTATAGSDYVAKSGTLSFASGQATQTVSVAINGDTTNETNETFFVNLSGNTNITDGQGIATIRNDDVVSIKNITFETKILSGADDVEQGTSGSVILDSSDLEMAVDRTVVQTIGLRFTRIDIPQGAIITSAYIQFQTEEVQTGTASLQIRGEDSDDAAAFTSASHNVSSRLKTDASVNWTPDPWGTIGETGLAQQTPNLAGIVQEIVNRSGWTPLNDIVFTVTGSGTRTAEAYESGAAPILHIEYTLPSGNDAGVGGISISDVTVTEGNSGTTTATFTVTRTGGTAAFSVNYATSNGTATAGSDYVAKSGTLTFAPGEMQKTISVLVNGDTIAEGSETFFVNLMNQTSGTIADGQGLGVIINDDVVPTQPTVVAIHDTTLFGSPDPSGLAYVPTLKTLFLADSEVEESPFFGTNNLFALNTDGSLKTGGAKSLLGFTKEPTGLAFDPTTGHLLVSDDSGYKVHWVDPANPTVKLGEFSTKPLGGSDPEDIAADPLTGHLFICNGSGNTNTPGIIEVDRSGTTVFSTITMPSAITDAEALAYDAVHNVFFVSGKFSSKIWVLDRSGTILDTISVLDGFRRADGSRAKIADLELAPSSDPNDAPTKLSLYVADYGVDQVSDGRLFEINLGDPFWA